MPAPTSTPGKLWAYLAERFPPLPSFVYAAALFYAAWSCAGRLPGAGFPSWGRSLAGAFILFLSLLHLRLMDEHKDYAADRVAHPERLLSRGVVTLTDLKVLLTVVLALEAGLALALGWTVVLAWLALTAFTVALLVEFGLHAWLVRHLGWYLVTHQLVVLPMVALAAMVRLDPRVLDAAGLSRLALCALAMTCATVTWELVRKTWSPDREHAQADSYSRAWGRGPAVAATLAVAAAGLCAWGFLFWISGVSLLFLAAGGLGLLLQAAVAAAFLRAPTREISKGLELAGAVYSLACLVGAAVGFSV